MSAWDKRIFYSLLTLLVFFICIFAIGYVVSENTDTTEKKLSSADKNHIIAKYELEKPPIYERIFRSLRNKVSYDFGMSFVKVESRVNYFIIILVGLVLIIFIIIRLRKKN